MNDRTLGHIVKHQELRATEPTLRLPAAQQVVVRDIAISLRGSGKAIGVLFAGAGKGEKIKAAEAIARESGRDLYRVDVAAVISQYIGETEKNLNRVFQERQANGAIIFFDEADALFGKRSEVKDAHDRYASVEINYMFKLIEAHAGGVILATEIRKHLDGAFLRRIRFLVQFD